MLTPVTTPFALGKRDPKNTPALLFAKYNNQARNPDLTFPKVNYLSRIDWSGTMNGNDSFGDCVACGAVNLALLASTVLAATGLHATLDEVVAIYKTQNPGFDPHGDPHVNGSGSPEDNGMDEQTMLEHWVKTGFTVGGQLIKIAGFAKIDHTNLQELRNAISVFGTVLLGVQIAAVQQQQFPGVWSYDPASSIEGGHAIIAGGHEDAATDDVQAACWAAAFGTTDEFLTHQLDEAWGVITQWHLGSKEFIAGMDVATFAADFTEITGDPFPVTVVVPPEPVPVPAPTPEPVPEPTPSPTPSTNPDDVKLAQAAYAWMQHHHVGINETMVHAVRTWLTAKGL